MVESVIIDNLKEIAKQNGIEAGKVKRAETRELNGRMRLITVHIPMYQLYGLEDLVKERRYPNRSEAIRVAIRDLLKDELWVVTHQMEEK